MTRTLFLVDWRGTLNTLDNPVQFVKALQANKHFVVLHSNSMSDRGINAAAQACDDVYSKLCTRAGLLEFIREAMHEKLLDDVVVVDDETNTLAVQVLAENDIPFQYKTIEQVV